MVLICLNLLDSSSLPVRPPICKSHLSAERLISPYRRFLEELLFVPFEIMGVVSPSVRSLIVFEEHFKENIHRYLNLVIVKDDWSDRILPGLPPTTEHLRYINPRLRHEFVQQEG